MPTYPLLILLQVLWALGLTAGCWGIGRGVLRLAGWTEGPGAPETVLGLGLGVVLLSMSVFALCAFHAVSLMSLVWTACLWTGLGIGLLIFLPLPRPAEGPRPADLAAVVSAVLLGLLAAANVLPALTPAMDWDGVAYHLALPKLYLAAGGFVFRPDIFHNLFPQLTEMLYLLGGVFPYGSAAKLVHYAFGLLAAAAVHAAGRRSGLRTGAWLAALVFYAQYLVHLESGTAFIDLATTAFAALALLAWTCRFGFRTPERGIYLAAFFAGACGATKWHGLFWLAAVLVLAGHAFWTQKGPRSVAVQRSGWVLAWGLTPVLPYLVRAWVMGGDPVWPLGYGLWGGREWGPQIAERVGAFHQAFAGVRHDLTGLLRLPFDLVVNGDRFGLGGRDLRWPLLGGLFLSIAGWAWRPRAGQAPAVPAVSPRGIVTVLLLCGVLAAWFFSSPQVRFLLPLFPLAAWLAARGLSDLWRRGTWAARTAAVLCGLLMFAVHPPVHRDTGEHLQVVLGRQAPEAFLASRLDLVPACRYLNGHQRPGERVLLFGENRGFYLDTEYLWGDPLLQQVVPYRRLRTPDDLAARLEALGVRWVLFRTDLYGPEVLDPHSLGLMRELLARRGERVWERGPIAVYRLRAAAGTPIARRSAPGYLLTQNPDSPI